MTEPWCDTCRKPAVWSEFHGWRHSTTKHRSGVPAHLDTTGHEVTAREWWRTPPWTDLPATPTNPEEH